MLKNGHGAVKTLQKIECSVQHFGKHYNIQTPVVPGHLHIFTLPEIHGCTNW